MNKLAQHREQKVQKQDILNILSSTGVHETNEIFRKAREIRDQRTGNRVYTRALIELSNICRKNCYYCGLRAANNKVERYELSTEEVLETAKTAIDQGYTSFVLQSGERFDKKFVDYITGLLFKIQELGNHNLRITLSCGEQSFETYRRWKEAGADRYLLRIETSDKALFEKIHPKNQSHSYERRIRALKDLKKAGFQLGSGILIGFPGQSIEALANDLIFLKEHHVDMVGMGPYLMHDDTPLILHKNMLLPLQERYRISLLSIAALRMLMPDINIAAATALDSIDPDGRLDAIKAGANVLMPNTTPLIYRDKYFLYQKKGYLTEDHQLLDKFRQNEKTYGFKLEMQDVGDSKAYLKKCCL